MDDGYFCSLWRTTGFLMNFAAVLELVTIVAYIVILAGGKQKRQSGWKLLGALLVVTGAVQCAAMAIVVSFLLCSVRI
jgi:formate hydrogenlyase subunit 3/multisubunit Na+/H+ antiporter MnhD subunit